MRSAAEKIAQLSASVPQEVKNTRSGCAPSACATDLRDCCKSRAAVMPKRCTALGLPQSCVSVRVIACTAAPQGRVVAALSR